MDKSTYENFEYPTANESESGSDQFFIVQDNGTFLVSTTRQVPYASQQCAVFDVAPQQFLVDVENTSELMTVSDQYSTDAQSNLFTNSYLLQPGSTAEPEQIEQNLADSIDEVNELNKQNGACTEIILSDEQYHMLEQKGWLLLEIGDKMYVLNTLGLHDITTNEKLIEKLRNESQSNISQDPNTGTCHLSNDDKTTVQGAFKSIPSVSGEIQESDKALKHDSPENHNYVKESSGLTDCKELKKENEPISVEQVHKNSVSEEYQEVKNQDATEMNTRVLVIETENIRRVGNTLKVKAKVSLKDLPDKIHLGKSKNGKRLVAKVVKQNADKVVEKTPEINKDKPDESGVLISLSAPHQNGENNTAESEFYMLLLHLFRNSVNKTQCSAEDVVTANSVIAKLLQIPVFKPSVIDNDIIITKVLQKSDSIGQILSQVLTAVVTGRVSQIGDQWRFVHLPHMFQKMINDTEELVEKHKKIGTGNGFTIKDDYSVLHVQIAEAKEVITGTVRISVTVNKRNIPMNLIMGRHQQQPNRMYACRVCAAIFGTELELKDHQADHSLEEEESTLTMDVDQTNKDNDFCMIETEKGKVYTCNQCNATFNRLNTCKNHLKTHYRLTNHETSESAQDENNSKAVYKCNMCTCTYFHPSTLSKHILSRHIKVALQ